MELHIPCINRSICWFKCQFVACWKQSHYLFNIYLTYSLLFLLISHLWFRKWVMNRHRNWWPNFLMSEEQIDKVWTKYNFRNVSCSFGTNFNEFWIRILQNFYKHILQISYRKSIWKWGLHNAVHFVSAYMCLYSSFNRLCMQFDWIGCWRSLPLQ